VCGSGISLLSWALYTSLFRFCRSGNSPLHVVRPIRNMKTKSEFTMINSYRLSMTFFHNNIMKPYIMKHKQINFRRDLNGTNTATTKSKKIEDACANSM
jgi:hypothetical protein